MPAVSMLEHDGTPSEGYFYLEESHWHQCEKCDEVYWVWHECQATIKEKENKIKKEKT